MAIANTFNGLKPLFKDRFKRTKALLQKKGKATAELDASKNPMRALKDKSYLNLKGKKGVAS